MQLNKLVSSLALFFSLQPKLLLRFVFRNGAIYLIALRKSFIDMLRQEGSMQML